MSHTEHYSDYKWIKVKRHVDDPTKTWEERYNILLSHHEKEANFLIDEVRRLAAELDKRDAEAIGVQ